MRKKPFSAEILHERRSANGSGAETTVDHDLTHEVLAALERIEQRLEALPMAIAEPAAELPCATTAEPVDIAPVAPSLPPVDQREDQIVRTLEELAILTSTDSEGADRLIAAGAELDAIVSATESATHRILAAAEEIEEAIEEVLLHNRDAVVVEQMDVVSQALARVFEASTFQDITGQRISKVVKILGFLDEGVARMVAIWGDKMPEPPPVEVEAEPDPETADDESHLLNGPQLAQQGMSQSDIDALFD